MNFNEPYLAYKELVKAREKAKNFKAISFKNRILTFRRSKPNPKTGGYFVSPNGSKDNSGLRFNEAIDQETFEKIELKDWDKVYFERGHIYNNFTRTVTTLNNTFGSYGSGADPKFYGSDSFIAATWTSEAGGYYSTPLATAPLWVFNPAGEAARQGESDWIPVTVLGGNATQRIFSSAILNPFNTVETLTTAKARFKEFNFRMSFEYLISGYNTGTGEMTFNATVVGAAVGYPMKLYGQKQFATLEGDWWYDDTANELWIKTASDPTGLDWRVCTQDHAFILSTTGTTITGLELTQYYESAIVALRASNTSISANIHDIRTDGLFTYGNNTGTISYTGTITRCGLNGINVGGVSNLSVSGSITSIGKQLNYPWPINTAILKTAGCAIACFSDPTDANELATNIQVTEFEANDLAYMGCLFLGTNNLAEHCHIHNGLLRFDDGGGLYCYYQNSFGGTGTSGNVFRDCIVYDILGSHEGIANYTQQTFASAVYLDAGCNDTEIDGCTLIDCPWMGVFCNYNTEQTYIHDCTIGNNGVAQVMFYEQPQVDLSANFANNYKNVLEDNILVAKVGSVGVLTASDGTSANASYNPYTTGNADRNTYVILNSRPTSPSNPVSINSIAKHESNALPFQVGQAAAVFTEVTLAGWRTRNSEDAASTAQGFYLDTSGPSTTASMPQIEILVNPTASIDTQTLTTGIYNDLAGASLNSSDVPAWGSTVAVIKSTYYYLMDNFLGASGSSITGRVPKIGNTANVIAGTHTVNAGNEMASSVAGLVTWNLGVTNVQFDAIGYVTNVSDQMRYDFRLLNNTSSVGSRMLLRFFGTTVEVHEDTGSGLVQIGTAAFTLVINTSYRVRIVCNGTNVKVYVNTVLYIDATTTLTVGNYFGLLGNTTKLTNFITAYPL